MKHNLAGRQVLMDGSSSAGSGSEGILKTKVGDSPRHDGHHGNRLNMFQDLIWASHSPLVNFIHSPAAYAGGAGIMLRHVWNRPRKAINLSINCLRKMVMEVASLLIRQKKKGAVGEGGNNNGMVIRRQVAERFLQEGFPPGTMPVQRSCASICRFVETDSASFEIQIDVDSVPMWKGWAGRKGDYLDLGLEHLRLGEGRDNNRNRPGLVLLDDHSLDTGRYLIAFQDVTTISIFDKIFSVSTTLLGRPDMPEAGESDPFNLPGIRLTLALLDGSHLVIDAPEGGIIEGVDVFKDGIHFHGTGRGCHGRLDDGKVNHAHGSIARTLRNHLDRIGGVFTEIVPSDRGDQPLDRDSCLAAV